MLKLSQNGYVELTDKQCKSIERWEYVDGPDAALPVTPRDPLPICEALESIASGLERYCADYAKSDQTYSKMHSDLQAAIDLCKDAQRHKLPIYLFSTE